MARVRVNVTVDKDLLREARKLDESRSDDELIDVALAALVHDRRASNLDASYAAYDKVPLDEPDEWGDLQTFRIQSVR